MPYPVIGIPPRSAGACQVSDTCPLPRTPATLSDADGAESAVVLTGDEVADQPPAQPTEFCAVTWKT